MTLATPMERGRVHPIPASNSIEFDYALEFEEGGTLLFERDIRVEVDLWGSYGSSELQGFCVTDIGVHGTYGTPQWLGPGTGRDLMIDYLNTRDQRFAERVEQRAAEVYRQAAE